MSSGIGGAAQPHTLVASGLGDDTGGGLYALREDGVEALDALSSVGLAVAPDGSALARLLWSDDDPQTSGELLLYDRRGVLGYRRLDAVQEPHGAVWHEDRLVVVSTLTNSIVWLDAGGLSLRTWRAPGDGDCWHLNSLAVRDGRLVASAFGRFDAHRGWARPGAREGRGFVFDVERGDVLVDGLSCPHDPLPVGDGWLVCNSAERELLRLGRDGAVTARAALGGWTRGLALDDRHVYVGVSAHRLLGAEGRARVVALERETLRPLRSWTLPCREAFALALVPTALLAGVRSGFATNPVRLREGVGVDHGTPVATLLDAAQRRVRVDVSGVGSGTRAGAWLTLRYALENEGEGLLASGGEHSVVVGAFWLREGVELPGATGRARLPGAVGPGESAAGVLRVPVPEEPGSYRLRVAVGQEGFGWFAADAAGAGPWERAVDVHPGER